MATWYYRCEGQEVGPADEAMLRVLIDLQHISPNSDVRRSDQSFWVTAKRSPLAVMFGQKAEGLHSKARMAINPLSRGLLIAIRASLVTFLTCSLLVALAFSLFAFETMRSGDSFSYDFNFHWSIDYGILPEFIRNMIDALLVGLATFVIYIIQSIEAVISLLCLLAMPLYAVWLYKAAEQIYHASHPNDADTPLRVLLKHVLPPGCFAYPRQFLLRLYKISQGVDGSDEIALPRALGLWWRSYLFIVFGVIVLSLVAFVPPVNKVVLFGVIAADGVDYYPFRYLAIILFVALLWALPLCLASFLWLQSRISKVIFAKMPEGDRGE